MLDTLLLVLALGQEAPAVDFALMQTPVQVDVQPGLWLTRVRGTTISGGGSLKLDENLGLDPLTAGFRGELSVRFEPWTVKLLGAGFNATGSAETTGDTWGGLPVVAGDRTALNLQWLQFEGHYNALALLGDGKRHTNERLDLSVGPHVAVSWLDMEQRLTSTALGTSVTQTGSWWSVMGGVQLSMQADMAEFASWLHQLRVEVICHAGTTVGDGALAWEVRGGLTLMFTPNVGATVGYRLMEFNDLAQDNWTISPRFPGLFIAVNVSF
jgi:hypothetical protein